MSEDKDKTHVVVENGQRVTKTMPLVEAQAEAERINELARKQHEAGKEGSAQVKRNLCG